MTTLTMRSIATAPAPSRGPSLNFYSLITEYSLAEILARLQIASKVDQISEELSISDDMRQALEQMNALIGGK